MNKELILQIAIAVRKELRSNRESMLYYELENFVGCLLATFLGRGLLTIDEEKELRKRILDE